MDYLIDVFIASFAISFLFSFIDYLAADFFSTSWIKLIGVYPAAFFALWYLNMPINFPLFICAGAAAWLSLFFSKLVEKMTVQVIASPRRRM